MGLNDEDKTVNEQTSLPPKIQPARVDVRPEPGDHKRHSDEPPIVIEGLVNQFGTARVHDGLDLTVRRGEIIGATVTEVPAYESGCPQEPDVAVIAALQAQRIDVITFASSKTVRHTCQLFEQGLGNDWLRSLDAVAIASIGPKTSETCWELLGRVDIEAAEYTLDGLTQAMTQWASESLA